MSAKSKTQNNNAIKNAANRRHPIINLAFWGTGLILILSPFFQGLYYDRDMVVFLFLIGSICSLYLLKNLKCTNEHLDLIDIGLSALTLCYLFSLPFSANKGDAMLGSLRALGYFILYFTVSRSLNDKTILLLTRLIVLIGALLTLAGIGSSINFPPIPSGWGASLASTFQYRNALGGYLVMVFPLALLNYLRAAQPRNRYISLGLLFINFLGLLGSQSRGAYIIGLVILILSIINFSKGSRTKNIILLMILLWSASDTWTLVFWAGSVKSPMVLLLPFLGMFIVFCGERLLNGFVHKPKHVTRLLLSIVIFVVLVAGVYPPLKINTSQTSNSQLGGAYTSEVAKSISPEDTHFQERLYMYKDALKMLRDRPFTGFGANAWNSIYKQYQSYLYYAKDPHSYPVKVLVETGVPGLLSYLILLTGFLYTWLVYWKSRKNQVGNWLGLSILGIILHSFVDLDLSLGAIYITFIAILGAFKASQTVEHLECTGVRTWSLSVSPQIGTFFRAVILGFSLLTLTASVLFRFGISYAAQGSLAQNLGKYPLATNLYTQSLAMNPFQASVYADLAQIESFQGVQLKNPLLLKIAEENAQRAINLSPYDPLLHSVASNVYLQCGKPDLAFQEAEKNITLAGLYPESYETTGSLAILYAQHLITQDKPAEAKVMLQDITELPQRIVNRLGLLTPEEKSLWLNDPHLSVTPKLQLQVGKAEALLGNYTKSLALLNALAGNSQLNGEALLWKGVVERMQKDPNGDIDIDKAKAQNPQLANQAVEIEKLLRKNV